jgi:hypothetical protein
MRLNFSLIVADVLATPTTGATGSVMASTLPGKAGFATWRFVEINARRLGD